MRKILNGKLPNKIVWDPIKKGFNFSIFKLLKFNSKIFINFVNKKSYIYKIISKKQFKKYLFKLKDGTTEVDSKFLFRFMSAKIFLELNG